jgi:hypothetical protein
MKLTSMGVTVTISSGDNGAPGDEHYCNFPSGSGVYDTGWTVSEHNGFMIYFRHKSDIFVSPLRS